MAFCSRFAARARERIVSRNEISFYHGVRCIGKSELHFVPYGRRIMLRFWGYVKFLCAIKAAIFPRIVETYCGNIREVRCILCKMVIELCFH